MPRPCDGESFTKEERLTVNKRGWRMREEARVGGTRIIDRRWKRAFGRKPIIRHEGGYVRPGSELSGEVSIGAR